MKKLLSSSKRKSAPTNWNRGIPCLPQNGYEFEEGEPVAYQWSPPFHWHENDSHFCLEWDIEGLGPDDLELMVQQRTLIIKERDFASQTFTTNQKMKAVCNFVQRIRWPKGVQVHKGKARYQFGKLTVCFPKTSLPIVERLKSTCLSLTQTLSTKLESPRFS